MLDELLEEQKKVSSSRNLVFSDGGRPISVYKLRNEFDRVVKEAGIRDFRFKDFRHTAKTKWAEAGIPPEAAMLAAGHRSLSSRYRYVNLKETELLRIFQTAFTVKAQENWNEVAKRNDG